MTKIEPLQCDSIPADPPPLTDLVVWPGGIDIVSMDGATWTTLIADRNDAIALIRTLRRCLEVPKP